MSITCPDCRARCHVRIHDMTREWSAVKVCTRITASSLLCSDSDTRHRTRGPYDFTGLGRCVERAECPISASTAFQPYACNIATVARLRCLAIFQRYGMFLAYFSVPSTNAATHWVLHACRPDMSHAYGGNPGPQGLVDRTP